MTKAPKVPAKTRKPSSASLASSNSTFVQAFLADAAKTPSASAASGRLIFALDATASRQSTWDMACGLQGTMFDAVGKAGGLAVQLIYYRGHGECRASKWMVDTTALARIMTAIRCRAGLTQLVKVLRHGTRAENVDALVFVGDAFEENRASVIRVAGSLADRSVPVFMFQEGSDPAVQTIYKEIADATGGAYARFDEGSADALARLLRAVARYATAGRRALDVSDDTERLLLEQLK